MSQIQYGFVDSDNRLLEIAVFQEGETELVEKAKQTYGATAYYEIDLSRQPAVVGKSTWTGSYFTPGFDFPSWNWDMEKEEFIPPVPYPENSEDGATYHWSESDLNWIRNN